MIEIYTACYQVVYYPNKSLFEMLGGKPGIPYTTGSVASIRENTTGPC